VPSETDTPKAEHDLTINVLNSADLPVVVSINSEGGGRMPGFLPGERGTVVLHIPPGADTVSVEVLALPGCRTAVSEFHSSDSDFSVVVINTAAAPGVGMVVRAADAVPVSTLPRNGLHCSGG
jgi:hypothetical protein